MRSLLKQKITGFWNAGHERSLKIRRNIVYTFLIKGVSVAIGFLLLPLTLNYINPVQYGIWITIISVVTWINTFDIGLSNGLRNKLAHALALNKQDEILRSVSTTYLLLFIIATSVFILFAGIGSCFNWNNILRLNNSVSYSIWPLMLITLGGLCIQFMLKPINTILIATHQNFKSSLLLLGGQVLTLIGVFILKLYTAASLYKLVGVAVGAPVLMYILAHIYLFRTSLSGFVPRRSCVDLKMARSLFGLGGVFFLIQIGALILYETDNILITRIIGPASVTSFNIAYKYFSVLTIAFSIIIAPYWSAFTDAYAKNDFDWIKSTVKRMRLIWLCFLAGALFLYAGAGIFYNIWLGSGHVPVPPALSLTIAIYTVLQIWTDIHTYLLNGTGKLRIQLILVITTSILNIPLSIWLMQRIGVAGTAVANITVIIIMNVFFIYQSNLIINQKAKGIWNK